MKRLGLVRALGCLAGICLQLQFLHTAHAAEPPAPAPPAPVPAPAAQPAVPVAAPEMNPPPAPPPGPTPTAAPVMSPPPPPPAGPVPVNAPTMTPAPPPPVAAPPPPPPPNPLAIGYSFGVRVGLRLQDPDKPANVTEVHLDPDAYDATAEARFHGAVTDNFSWVANFNTNLAAPTLVPKATLGVMDLIAQFKAAKEFQIWAGRLLVPSDRSNFCGPFFSIPWNYPGFYFNGAAPLGPKDNATGRDQGITAWGNAFDDKLKYYIGAYGIDTVDKPQPYGSARISYSLQGSEPGYFGSSTYYGAKDVVTIAVAGQYQKNGATDFGGGPGATKDMTMFMADVFAEEHPTGAGTFTFEGDFYKFTEGYAFAGFPSTGNPIYAPGEAFYVEGAYMTEDKIGVGRLQPLVRVQHTLDPQGGNDPWTVVDAALAYVVKDYSGRVVLTYQHMDLGAQGGSQNSLQLGVQLQTL